MSTEKPNASEPDQSKLRRVAREWYEENKEAVDSYNEMIETHGLFSDGVRTF